MAELTKPPRRVSNQDDDPLAGTGGGGEDEEEAGGIANMRVVNASKVRGGSRGVRVCYFASATACTCHTDKQLPPYLGSCVSILLIRRTWFLIPRDSCR